jgi:hypothetical protein
MDSSNLNLRLQILLPVLTSLLPWFITPLVHSHHKDDAIHFIFSNTFDLVLYALLLHKLDEFGLSSLYVAWLHSYATNKLSLVCCHGTLPVLYEVLSRVPQGMVLITNCVNLLSHAWIVSGTWECV